MYHINSKMYDLLLMEESIQYGITMPHDKLFKDILNDKDEFYKFINEYIKCNKNILKPEDIEKVTTSFITPIFKNKESDILYKEINQEKYYLVEHQSTIDESMSFRMLNYCINVLNDVTEKYKLKNKSYKLPKIIPIVLYTGDKKWNAVTKLTDKQENVSSDGTLIELQYKVIDINDIDEEKLLEMNTSLAYAMLIEKNRGKEKLINILNKIALKCNTEEKAIKMKRVIKYILEPVLGEKETQDMLEKFTRMGGEEIMTAIDCLIRDIEEEKKEARKIGRQEGWNEGKSKGILEGIQEGRKKGREEGREEGIKSAIIMIVKELRKNGFSDKKICQITKLTEAELEKIC